MAKRELGGGTMEASQRTPIVNLTSAPGLKFTGKILDKGTEVKLAVGSTKWVYNFEVHDTDAPIVIKNASNEYETVDVEQYDKVAIFATKLLNRKLSQAQVGDIIEITYTGKDKGKQGQSYHNYTVMVVE